MSEWVSEGVRNHLTMQIHGHSAVSVDLTIYCIDGGGVRVTLIVLVVLLILLILLILLALISADVSLVCSHIS